MNKPNIVYIFSDQHRGDTLGCSGHPAIKTPYLDRLAREGVNFTRCYTNAPLCMPARASMMTGQYVCEHGVWTNELSADPSGQSHVRNIREAGYHTAVIGKTHLYVHNEDWVDTREKVDILKKWGFEYSDELIGPLATISHECSYTDYLREKGLLKIYRKYLRDYHKGWQNGTVQHWDLPPCPIPAEDHLDSYTGKRAVEWIKNYQDKKPFYLQVLFPGPHDPFDSPQSYRDLYKQDEMPIGIMDFPEGPLPFYVRGVLKWSGLDNMSIKDKQKLRTLYYGKISLIDNYIGKIFETLKERGLADNTWIIYSSDHGEMLGDHKLSHKIVFYEGALRIPLIIRPPKGMIGFKSRIFTDQIDITTTLLEIAGAKPLPNCDGSSLLNQIVNREKEPKLDNNEEIIFSEVYGYSMVRNEYYKLTVESDTLKAVELFDLKKDPKELINIVNDSSMESVKENLIFRFLKKKLLKNLSDGKFRKMQELPYYIELKKIFGEN